MNLNLTLNSCIIIKMFLNLMETQLLIMQNKINKNITPSDAN